MKGQRWFRFYAEAMNDPKVDRLAPTLYKTWIKLLCLSCSSGGKLPSIDDIAYQLRISVQDAQSQVDELVLASLIDIDAKGGLHPHNWETRQYVSDTSTERVKKHRRNKFETPGNVSCNVSVTPPEQSRADSDTEQKQTKAEPKAELHPLVSQSAAPDELKSAFNGTTDAMLSDLLRWMGPHAKLDNARKWLTTTLSASGRDATINAYQALVAGQGQGVPISDPIRYWAKTAQTMHAKPSAQPATRRGPVKENLSDIIAQRKAAREAAGVST